MIAAVIPTRFDPPTLKPLLKVLRADKVLILKIDTTGREPRIYDWWNEGVAEARRLGATEIAILNDDIAILPGTIPMLAKAVREHGLGVAYPEVGKLNVPDEIRVEPTAKLWAGPIKLGMTGYIFVIPAELTVTFSSEFTWYGGDNFFEQEVRVQGYDVSCVLGLRIEHDHSYSSNKAEEGKAQWDAGLKYKALADMQLWRTRQLHTDEDLERRREYLARPLSLTGKMTAKRIPAVLHRVAIGKEPDDAARFWVKWQELHPGWTFKTWTLEDDWPLTGWALPYCKNAAGQADLMRLEVLWREGGVYTDWDIEPYRPIDAFLPLEGIAAWDATTGALDAKSYVANGFMGFRPKHPAIKANLELAIERFSWNAHSNLDFGVYATDAVMRDRTDILLLPRQSFYCWDWDKRKEITDGALADTGWAYGLHRMHASWVKVKAKPERMAPGAIAVAQRARVRELRAGQREARGYQRPSTDRVLATLQAARERAARDARGRVA